MNLELFIARKVFSEKENKKGVASKIVSIAVASISLGLAVMLLSVAILFGFKKEVREKVIGFGSHFQVVNFDRNYSYETLPIEIDSFLIQKFENIPHVKHLQFFATKPGLIKTEKNIHGIVLKGVDHNFDWSFFQKNLVAGNTPNFRGKRSNDVLISERVSNLLQLKLGDPIFCYFYREDSEIPLSRKFNITGIYRTSLEEFDELFVVGDLQHVQRLSRWNSNKVSGYEISIDNFKYIDETDRKLETITLNYASEKSMLLVQKITDKYSMLFDWLAVLDMNVWVLLVLMIAVAGINMISGLLIIILERSRMIGILKAMGYPNFSLRKVFLYLTGFLSLRGLLWGNLFGIGIALLQYFFQIIPLDPSSYYLDTVPILLNPGYIILLNVGTLLAIIAMVFIPTLYISKITPVDSIRFE